jgi:hypothetical protein
VRDTEIGKIQGGPATIGAGGSTFEVDEIVVAGGRTPASANLGLERVGVGRNPDGYIDTDDHMAVPAPISGYTPSATSAAGPCSRTCVNTRRGSPAT